MRFLIEWDETCLESDWLESDWQRVKKTNDHDYWAFEVPFRYQKFILDSGSSTDNNRTGGDVQLKTTYRTQWDESNSFSVQGVLDNQYTTGKNYRLSGLAFPLYLTLSVPFFEDLGFINTFAGELNGQLYWQSDVSRRDYSYKLGTGLVKTFFESWNLSMDYYYLKNNSNVAAGTYTKGVISLLVSHNFI